MKLLLALATLALTNLAYAFPTAPFNALTTPIAHDDKAMKDDYDFEGIIKLSNCSGSLIKFNGQPATSKAIVLTNGHCYSSGPFGGMIQPGEVVYNKTISRDMKIFDKEMKLFPVKATKALYSTMTNTDITMYELSQTYAEIASKYKIEAFVVDGVRPSIGTNIDIVSGYWDKGYSCMIDAFIFTLKEAGYTMKDSVRYAEGCNTIGGTSGSPIIARGTRSVIAINNTGNEAGQKCTMDNPCEVSENGSITVMKGRNYGQQIYNIYTCLRPDFNIDLTIPGCELPKAKI